MSKSDVVTPDVLLELVDNLLNCTPLGDVCLLERNKFLLSIYYFPFLDNELRLINITANLQASHRVSSHCIDIMLRESLLIVLKSHLRLLSWG
jgi:hypothetical protein